MLNSVNGSNPVSNSNQKVEPFEPRHSDFYEKGCSIQLSRGVVIRYSNHPKYENNNFFFVGKKRQNQVTQIEFSQFEACVVVEFLEKLINQIREAPVPKHDMSNLIPLFKGNKYRATENPGRSELISYFSDEPELSLHSIRGRVAVDMRFGTYELRLVSPVSDEISRQHHGWPGPQISLQMPELVEVYRFIKQYYLYPPPEM